MDNADLVTRTLYLGIQDSLINELSVFHDIGDINAFVTMLPPIRSLEIACVGQRISVADMQVLVHGFRSIQNLDDFAISESSLSDEHIQILTADFLTHPALRRKIEENPGSEFDLRLENNCISPRGAQDLIQATLSFSAFKTLNLFHNTTIGYDGLRLIGEALSNSMLTELNLKRAAKWVNYDNDDDELAKEQKLKCGQAAKALVEGVRNNVHLRVLNLEEVYLPRKALAELDFYLEMNCNFGRHLLSHQHALSPAIWCLILAKFGHAISVVFFYVRELPMLVSGGMTSGKKRRR
jgi:hypothetical protein